MGWEIKHIKAELQATVEKSVSELIESCSKIPKRRFHKLIPDKEICDMK